MQNPMKRNKRKSVLQERRTASDVGGRVQPGSGAPGFYKGDVRKQGDVRIECKTTGSHSFILKLPTIEKIKSEALLGGEGDWAMQVEFQTVSGNKKFAIIDWATYLDMRARLQHVTSMVPESVPRHFLEPVRTHCIKCGVRTHCIKCGSELNSYNMCTGSNCE